MPIDLSIIIVNYNTFDLTKQCVHSIVSETIEISYEIIIVDNASAEKLPDSLFKEFPQVKMIQNSSNVGFGIANNQAMKIAKGNYFLLLNSDTIITNNGITKSLKFIKENEKVDILTCRQLNEQQKDIMPARFYFKTHSIFQYLLQNPIFEIVNSKLNKTKITFLTQNTFIKNISGAYLLLKKEVFTSTKGFDPDFFIYYEETEWCERIKTQFNLFYLHDVSFIHLHGKSAPRLVMQKQMHLSGGLFWYKKGILNYHLFLVITYFVYLPMWVLLSIFNLKATTRSHFFKYVKIYLSLLPYFLFEIPKYKKGFSLRKHSLKLNELC